MGGFLLTAFFFSLASTARADTTFASDTFTDTDTTLLENHVPDVGTSWTKGSGSTGVMTINSNTIYSSAAGAAARFWYIGATSATADYDVQATFNKGASTGSTPTIIGRASTSAVTAYGVRCDAPNGNGWTLRKWISGSAFSLASTTASSCTTAKVGRLRMRGDQISFYVDNVLTIGPITDSSITAAGRAGVSTYFADAFTTRYLDTWSALDDTTAPTYSAVASSTTSVTASITWTTDEPGTSQVEYGPTTGYGTFSTLDTTSTTTHSTSLSSLSSNTTYHFRVATKDASNNVASSTDYTLLTAPTDSTPPVRSAGSPSGTLAAGTTSTTLSLTTDESATCKYGTVAATAYADIASTFSTTGGTSHSQSLTGLTPVSYTYYVRCQDVPGNADTDDYTISFTIPPDTTAPSIPTNLTATATTTSQIGLSWTASTDDIAVTGYSIYRGGLPLASTTLTTYYNTGLTPSTLYSYTVSAYDAAANDSVATGAATATTADPQTYYLSTTGSDSTNGLTTDTAWQSFAHAWTILQPGDTLQVADGSYTTPSPPAAKSGIAGYPITITAINPGNVQITGPMNFVGNTYLTFVGLTITGTNIAVSIYSNGAGAPSQYLTFQQIGWTCTSVVLNDNACFRMYDGTNHVLVEDSWGYGGGRYTIMCQGSYNLNTGCDYNTFRRLVLRMGPSTSTAGNPQASLSLYFSSSNTVENVIALDGSAASDSSNAAFYVTGHTPPPNADSNKYYGLIALNNLGIGLYLDCGGAVCNGNEVYNSVFWGSSRHAAAISGGTCDNTVLDHNTLAKADPTGVLTGMHGFTNNICTGTSITNDALYSNSGYGANRNSGSITTNNNNGYYGNTAGTLNGITAGAGDVTTDPAFSYITRIETASPYHNAGSSGDIGANVINRYQDGVLTGTALWPWPNEARIKTEMCNGVSTGWCSTTKTLTTYIWEYLGNTIPADIYGTTAPTLTTEAASSLAVTTATLNGTITALGGANVTVSGFAYGTVSSLTTTIATTTGSGTASSVPTAITAAISSLTCATTYYFRPYATNSVGTGLGTIVSFTTSACPDSTAPTIPSGLTATAVSSSQINLSWSASTDDVAVTGYHVYRGGVLIASPTGTSYSNTGLSASTAYSYTVSAFDAVPNESVQSSSASATTQAAAVASSGGGGGGGGGGGSSTPTTSSTPVIHSSGLSTSQIQSILNLLIAFDVDQATLATVSAILNASSATSPIADSGLRSTTFTRDLFFSATGPDVRLLQHYLNTHGYPVALSGLGSLDKEITIFGPATKSALIKFQFAHNLPATGYFGPMTRKVVGNSP